MNVKVFSILVGILVALIVALGGTYYYLFEYPKTQTRQAIQNHAQNSNPSSTQAFSEPSFGENSTNASGRFDGGVSNSVIAPQNDENNTAQSQAPVQTPMQTAAREDTQDNINQAPPPPKAKISNEEKAEKPTTKEVKKEEKKQEKRQSDKQNKQKTALSTIKEYQQRGKDGRLEPELSSETIKVYVMDGKALSEYRIGLLKDMLEPIQLRSKDYNLSVFIQMLPKNEMNISIYNKDIIFSNMKKSYKHIDIGQIAPHLSDPESLNSNIKREEVIERIAFKVEEDAKGSDFSRHIKGLKKGLETAQYFFPFCEIIEISTAGKK